MNRRGLFKFLGGAAAAAAVAPAMLAVAEPNVAALMPRLAPTPVFSGLVPVTIPIQTEVGGLVGFYQPDGGTYFHGGYATYSEEHHLVSTDGADYIIDREQHILALHRFRAQIPEPEYREFLIARAVEQVLRRQRESWPCERITGATG